MFGFPDQSRQASFRYKNNILQTVTFQIKFTSEYTVEERKDEIVLALNESFPSASQSIRKATFTKLSSPKTPIVSEENRLGSLRFQSEDGEKVFSVEEDSLALTILGRSYINFDEAKPDLARSLYTTAEILHIKSIDLVSIRKVNGIAVSPVPGENKSYDDLMKTVFNEELVAHATRIPAATKLRSSVTNCWFEESKSELNIIYGLLPKALENGARQVILDIDLMNSDQGSSIDYIEEKLTEINSEIFNVFKWSLTPFIEDFLNTEIEPS